MKEQKFADFLPASHREALHLLTDGLCRIREAAIEAPAHAMQVADVMHNIPGILSGEDRAGEGYLTELIAEGRALINDNDWRKAPLREDIRMNQIPRTPLYLAARRANLTLLWCGLACLLISVVGALAIWAYPYSGPDLRTEFCMVLVPSGVLGVVFSFWGFCELRAGKKRNW